MSLIKPADKVVFANDKLEKDFLSLNEKDWLKKAIIRAINNLRENVFCGERIKKELIPIEYIKNYGIDNLWRRPLPKGWRLVYSLIVTEDKRILAVIIEYFDHKNYEKRFGY